MEPPQVHLSDWIEKGFKQYKENISIVIPASFIALILSVCSAGILAGPMLSGVLIITLGLLDRREPKPMVSDLFKGFRFFLHSLLFVVIWGIVVFGGDAARSFPAGCWTAGRLVLRVCRTGISDVWSFPDCGPKHGFQECIRCRFSNGERQFLVFLECVGHCKRRRQYRGYPVRNRHYPDGPPADLYSHRCLSGRFWCCKRRTMDQPGMSADFVSPLISSLGEAILIPSSSSFVLIFSFRPQRPVRTCFLSTQNRANISR